MIMNTKNPQSFIVGLIFVILCMGCLGIGYWYFQKDASLISPLLEREPSADIGPQVRDESRPTMWNSSNMIIPGTDYMVTAGAHLYQDESDLVWDFYSIEIGQMVGGEFRVWFSREMEMDIVGEEIAKKKASEYVRFDPETRVVQIDFGEQKFSYQLPENDNEEE